MGLNGGGRGDFVSRSTRLTRLQFFSSLEDCFFLAEVNFFLSSLFLLSLLVNSLPAIDAHERQLFDKLLWGLVTSTIFVHC
jgi:hypothetical protein